jgi:hypothetical protein
MMPWEGHSARKSEGLGRPLKLSICKEWIEEGEPATQLDKKPFER